jgi:energy-coupling factor transporter ATP-binding protein EcfA2
MPEGSQRPVLRVTALSLHRFLGLQRRDQALHFAAGELSPGVTLIVGPNGSGKTTLARAIEGILWPESVTDPMAAVRGSVELAGEAWTVDLAGPSARWLRGGVPVTAPSYCPASDRDRYRLSLPELLTADDATLAAAICRELGGGYSLAEAAAQLGFAAHPALPRKALQRLRQAEEAVAQATREQSGLRRGEAELPRLRSEEADARQAATLVEAVARLLQWREAGRALQAARRQSALYDPRIASLRGTELAQFRDLQQREGQAKGAGARAAADLALREAALAARCSSHSLPSPECLSRCRSLALQLQQAESDVRKAQTALAGSQAREVAARELLAPRLTPEQLGRLDRLQPDSSLAEAVRTASAAAIADGTLACFAAVPLWAEPVADAAALEAQRRGLDLLLAWLQEPAASVAPAGASPASRLAFTLALAGAALALLLSFLVHASLGFAAAVLGLLAWLIRPAAPPPSRRAELAAGYARLGLELPASWDAAAVAQCADALARRWSLGVGRRELAGQGAAARRVLEQQAAAGRRAAAECQARNLARLGVALDPAPLAAFHLVTRVAAWQACRDDLVQADRSGAAAREVAGALLERLRRELAPCGGELPVDSASALARVDLLESELAARAAETNRRDALALQVEEYRREAVQFADRCRGLIESVGIRADEAVDAEGLLVHWDTQRQAAAAAAAELQSATALVTRCRTEAQQADAAAQELRSLRTPHLERCRSDFERTAARRDQIVREIESTETLVREAKRKHDLEQHLAEREAAMAELRREREVGWQALAGQGCLELVAAGLETQSSGVLRRAQELLSRITRGRYRLLAEESGAGAAFAARDTETERLHDLDSLSSGTRVQMLLATRLAFIAEKEGDGPRLPLLLDEVLGNSDETRAGTIIDVVAEVVHAGRQVFCFTAQQDEVNTWQARLGQAQVPFAVCWLPRAAAVPPSVSLAPVPAPPLPRPQADESPLDYAARLGVPALDRFDTAAGNLHLWYLVDDLEALHALLQAGYRTWGQLGSLLCAPDSAAVLAGILPGALRLEPARLAAKAEMVILTLSLLRLGHGRPLGRAALAASGLVTARYLDDVGQILENAGGDAARLVERLLQGDVRGFRSRNVEALAAWLAEQGYVDRRPRLGVDEVRTRLHSTASGYLAAGVLSLDDIRGVLRLAEAPARLPTGTTRSHNAED